MTIARTRTKFSILGVLINLYLIDLHVTCAPVYFLCCNVRFSITKPLTLFTTVYYNILSQTASN